MIKTNTIDVTYNYCDTFFTNEIIQMQKQAEYFTRQTDWIYRSQWYFIWKYDNETPNRNGSKFIGRHMMALEFALGVYDYPWLALELKLKARGDLMPIESIPTCVTTDINAKLNLNIFCLYNTKQLTKVN